MLRRSFLNLAVVPLLGVVAPVRDELALPVELHGGRFFALPRLARSLKAATSQEN